jgi:hypothetical protein
MAEYRLYTVGHEGHFVGYEPLVCVNDAEAIEKAKRLVVAQDIELWSGEGSSLGKAETEAGRMMPAGV